MRPPGWDLPPDGQDPPDCPHLSTGMFHFLSRQVHTPDLQQSVRVPDLGHRAGLEPGPVLHGVRPLGHGHPPLPDGRAVPRGEHSGPGPGCMGAGEAE